MNAIKRMESNKNNYTTTELSIYQYIKDYPREVIRCSIEQISKESKTSKAAIIRFCKKIGYSGYSEFKYDLSRAIISGKYDNDEDENLDLITSITSLYSAYIKQLNSYIDMEIIKQLSDDLYHAKRIKIIGNNRTGLSAMQMRLRMSKIGYDGEAITDMALVGSIQGDFREGDLIILFSIYGNNPTYTDLFNTVSKTKAKLALITMTSASPLCKKADYSVILPPISKASSSSFLDDQVLFFVFIEILLSKLASY